MVRSIAFVAASIPVLVGCAGSNVDVVLRHDDADERATKAQLERLLGRHDLRPWLFTKTVAIDSQATPFSHPTLTLHTRHLRDDLLLLSTFVHEQSHWYLVQNRDRVDAARRDLEKLVPDLPVGFPDGAHSATSSYEHLLVIALEERALKRLVGELAAHQAMEFWSSDHYRVLYRVVRDKRREIAAIMRQHGLEGPGAQPTSS